jgi:hypothetical protein
MDGGSDDGTVPILRQLADRLTDWHSGPDGGQAAAVNAGFARLPHGEIMGWLNSDDMLLPGALHAVAEAFVRHPRVDVVYGHRLLIDENDHEIGRWILPPHDDDVLGWADFIPQETLFWRRSLWDRVGGRLDESFRFAMDWELLLRFQRAGARFLRLPRLQGAFRIHSDQKTCTEIDGPGHAEMARLRRLAHGRPVDQSEVDGAIAGYLARHLAWNAASRLAAALLPGRTVILGEAGAPVAPAVDLDPGMPLPIGRLLQRKPETADVATTAGLSLGAGWHAREWQAGRPFRWAEEAAAIRIRGPRGGAVLRLELERGPSLGDSDALLHLRHADGSTLGSVGLGRRQCVDLALPPSTADEAVYMLAVDGKAARPVPNDPRRLCFRVFAIALVADDAP